ncbi:MAG: hypothetical protein J7K17_03605 [Candidatus Omnitrophica bacterium]|nr:hypothetical protein [Candidatus Omnitrophota bacterium]
MNTQALIFTVFMIALVAIIGIGLWNLWEPVLQIHSLHQENLIAFYLAQAGIERAKVEVLNNVNLSGTSSWFTDLDPDPSDSYQLRYRFRIQSGGADKRILRGDGQIFDTNRSQVIAFRQINVTVDGILDVDGDGKDDDNKGGIVSDSWFES